MTLHHRICQVGLQPRIADLHILDWKTVLLSDENIFAVGIRVQICQREREREREREQTHTHTHREREGGEKGKRKRMRERLMERGKERERERERERYAACKWMDVLEVQRWFELVYV